MCSKAMTPQSTGLLLRLGMYMETDNLKEIQIDNRFGIAFF